MLKLHWLWPPICQPRFEPAVCMTLWLVCVYVRICVLLGAYVVQVKTVYLSIPSLFYSIFKKGGGWNWLSVCCNERFFILFLSLKKNKRWFRADFSFPESLSLLDQVTSSFCQRTHFLLFLPVSLEFSNELQKNTAIKCCTKTSKYWKTLLSILSYVCNNFSSLSLSLIAIAVGVILLC